MPKNYLIFDDKKKFVEISRKKIYLKKNCKVDVI